MTVAGASLVAGLCAAVAVLAVAGMVAAWRGWTPHLRRPGTPRGRRRALDQLPGAWRERYRYLLGAAGVVAVVVWVFTGWPVHGLVAGTVVAGAPFVLHPGGSARARIERIEALAEWLHQLASLHVTGLPLEETIRGSAASAPPGVRREVQMLATRLRPESGIPAAEAYRALADEMADGAVDHVVLLLLTHSRDRERGLSTALEALAESLGQQAADARSVEADRAKVRTSARWISFFVLGAVAVTMVNRSYTEPYGTSLGQGLLLVLAAAFAGLLVQMHRMAQADPEPRLLAPSRPVSPGVPERSVGVGSAATSVKEGV